MSDLFEYTSDFFYRVLDFLDRRFAWVLVTAFLAVMGLYVLLVFMAIAP